MPTLHQTFTPVTIHTAKCDICNQHNRSVLFRCADCGWHVCTPCWTEKGGDGTHVMNEGARGWRGAGFGRGSENARSGVDRGGQGERSGLGAGGRARVGERERERDRGRDRGRRQRTDRAAEAETGRDNQQPPISIAAAADLLIQAASRATPSPSLSPRPSSSSSSSFQRPAAEASARLSAPTRPSASVRASDTAGASARGSHPSDSASAAASRREKMNISRLLRAAETIDGSSPLAPPPPPLPVQASRDGGRRGKRRAASPLFVEYGSVEVEEEVVVEDSDPDLHYGDDDGDGDGDDEMTGMETGMARGMTPEPRSPDEDMGDEMPDAWPGRGFQISDAEREVIGGLRRVSVPVPVADGGEKGVPKGGRGDGVVVRGRAGKDGAGAKVPVARRLRELYRSAVLVKDRKGRIRRVGGGLVGRREGL